MNRLLKTAAAVAVALALGLSTVPVFASDDLYCKADANVINEAYKDAMAAAKRHGGGADEILQDRWNKTTKISDAIAHSDKMTDCDSVSLNIVSFFFTGVAINKTTANDRAFVRDYFQKNRDTQVWAQFAAVKAQKDKEIADREADQQARYEQTVKARQKGQSNDHPVADADCEYAATVVLEAFDHAIADAHFWQAPHLRAEKELAAGDVLSGLTGDRCRANAQAIIGKLRAELTH